MGLRGLLGGSRRPSAPLAGEPGEEGAWARARGLVDTHRAWRAPGFDGGVVAGRQQELLLLGAEDHRVDHVLVPQLGQADVVVAVPDVAVPILCPTARAPGMSPRPPTGAPPHPAPPPDLATKSLLTSRKMKKHSSLGV